MLLWWAALGAIVLQSFWLTFVWLHNGGWKVHYVFFRISDTSSHFVICDLLCLCILIIIIFNAWLAGGFPATANAAYTRKERALYFLCMLSDRGDDNTSDPSRFNPSNNRTTTVSIRVKLCSRTFMDWWQTRVSPRTWWLLHQPGLNYMPLCGVA